jgi:hypothetical protein
MIPSWLAAYGSKVTHLVNGTGGGLAGAIWALRQDTYEVLRQFYDDASGGIYIGDLNTTSMRLNRLAYISGNSVVSAADAAQAASADYLGNYTGLPGTILTYGVTTLILSTASATPVAGNRLFLARADEEPLNAAAGKVRTTPPATGFVVEVGKVLSVDPTAFSQRRYARCVLQPPRIVLARP